MISRFVVMFITLLLPSILNANATLLELLHSGAIDAHVESLGGHSGKCIALTVSNNRSEAVHGVVPPGQVFRSESASLQDIVVTQELLFVLTPNATQSLEVSGFCCQSSHSSPRSGSGYTVGPMADFPLLEVAQYISEHPELPRGAQQNAVWVMSDCNPFSSVALVDESTHALRTFIAETLNLPKPWYTTEHLKQVNNLFSDKVLRMYGSIPFSVEDYTTVSVAILNEGGRVVKTLVKNASYGPGRYDYPVELLVGKWPAGEYNIQLDIEERAETEKHVFKL